MRFRAELFDAGALSGILTSLEKISDDVIIILEEKIVHFRIWKQKLSEESVFVQIPVDGMFDDYRIESKNNNTIGIRTKASNLVAAIKFGDRAQKIVMKLHKKDQEPCIKIEMSTDSNMITQDLPIRLLNRRQIDESSEPNLPEPAVKVMLPVKRFLKQIMGRMKSFSEDVILTATSKGEMSLQVNAEMVTVKTFYNGLQLADKGGILDEDKTKITSQCRMNIKHLAQVLSTRIITASDFVLGCIVEAQAFVVYAEFGQNVGSATFYVPLLTM